MTGCIGSPEQTEKSYYGIASHYGPEWDGRLTANGETFHNRELTAAHKTLPFDTRVRVTLPSTGKSVVVRINDRGPYVKGREIDLSDEAARRIGLDHYGIAKVKLEILELGHGHYIRPDKRRELAAKKEREERAGRENNKTNDAASPTLASS